MDDPTTTPDEPRADRATDEQPQLPIDDAGEPEPMDDPIDDASANSFPASDPPSFTGSTSD